MNCKISHFIIYLLNIFLLFCSSVELISQVNTYRIFLKDKGPYAFEPGSLLYQSTVNLISSRAVERRKKVLIPDSIFSYEDAPVYEEYIDECSKIGAKPILKLRWKNYIVAECDSLVAENLKSLDFIKKVQPTSSKFSILTGENTSETDGGGNPEILFRLSNCGVFDYGDSFWQAQMLNVPALHSLGITGEGVLIGVLDNGFRWRKHSAFAYADIVAEYDFIQRDSLTENDTLDPANQDAHGTAVFSTICGFSPGHLIGIAPGASFLLAKTEDMRYEQRIEEDNYAAGIEWLESQGTDIITSSLAYYTLDSTEVPYSYSDLNGNTTITAQAVNSAVKRGVVCVSAAGNSGPAANTLVSPADADSVISVAAVNYLGAPASFTSRGPRGDRQRKPDISAMGIQTVFATNEGDGIFSNGNGTSLATPLIAGSVGLLLSLFPELKPWELRNILYSSATQANQPDDTLGYGVPDILKAIKTAGIAISQESIYPLLQYQRVVSNIVSARPIIEASLYVRFDGSPGFVRFPMYTTAHDFQYAGDLPLSLFHEKNADGYIIARNSENLTRRYPYDSSRTFNIEPNIRKIRCGIDQSLLPNISEDIGNAYVFPSVVSDFRSNIELNVTINIPGYITIRVYSLINQLAYSADLSWREEGIATYPIPVSNLSSGSYFIFVNYSGISEIVPFAIVR